ncbi:glycosyltransferase [Agathobaculum sp.]|uniref:glycosyltransferase n=1 Tax=Agathobaculum sp. TaxID=2048138 RepID=UPI003AF136C1
MNGNKKLLYIASSFGHLASFHQPYTEWLAQQGYDVHAAAGGEQRALRGVSRYIPLPFEKSMFSPRNFAAVLQLRSLLLRENYAMISLHTSLAAFFARLAVQLLPKSQRPVVMNTAHGYLFDGRTPVLKRTLLLGAERMTAPITDWLLTMNRQDEQIAKRYQLGRHIVPTPGMGIALTRFSPPSPAEKRALRRAMELPENSLVLIYAAEFSGRKNQKMLISAMPELPNAVLLLPGRGALLDECRVLAQQQDVADRVRFPGFASNIEQYYRAADLCVSSSRSEGLPFNVMEAMACGLPAVLSDVKGHEDLVRSGENGLLFPYDDQNAFIRAVKQAAEPALQAQMSAAAVQTAVPYGIDAVFPTLTAIYSQAIPNQPKEVSE